MSKDFGVVVSPWGINQWAASVGAAPTMPMQFVNWASANTMAKEFAQCRAAGYSKYAVTWEPWAPVDPSLGQAAAYAVQPDYANATIVAGGCDPYIEAFAANVAASGLSEVYIRWAHEMNGNWYPWSNDPAGYQLAFKRIHDIFAAHGASNAAFVFAPNPNMWQTDAVWSAGFWKYWPGGAYVDQVGQTIINQGGGTVCTSLPCPSGATTRYPAVYLPRLKLGYTLTGKPVAISEFNTQEYDRDAWLRQFLSVMDQSWIASVTLSQAYSRAQAQLGNTIGDLSWQLVDDSTACGIVKQMILNWT